MKYIASCSFGKDSLATILLAIEHGDPLDAVVWSEVMFSHADNISGEMPEHVEWIYGTAIPKLEGMGVKVNVVRAKRDYESFFQTTIIRGKRKGKVHGFVLGGMCMANRVLKVKPIDDYFRQYGDEEIIKYIGIAIDEPKRLERLEGNKVSLLEKYGYTELMAKQKCKEYDLLSPIYQYNTRGGCWFCPNCGYKTFALFKKKHPDLWQRLLDLGKTTNLCSNGFKYGETIDSVDRRIDAMNRQLELDLF